MLGLGEKKDEVLQVMRDICDYGVEYYFLYPTRRLEATWNHVERDPPDPAYSHASGPHGDGGASAATDRRRAGNARSGSAASGDGAGRRPAASVAGGSVQPGRR